jgi:hypothetical protein
MYTGIKRYPESRYFVYVLMLQHGKLYVGSTDNIYTRLADHFRCSSRSAVWVREYGPPVRVVEIIRNCAPEDEEYKYAEMADKFGFENVRGGRCCKLFVPREPFAVRTFTRRVPDTLDYVSRPEIQDILEKIKALRARDS